MSYNVHTFQVLEAVSLIDVRRHFIEALAPLFGMPLEADPVCILWFVEKEKNKL